MIGAGFSGGPEELAPALRRHGVRLAIENHPERTPREVLAKIERGDGEMRDLDLLTSVSNNIAGKTLCAFGDAAATPVLTTLHHFRGEFEAHIREGHCTLPAEWRAKQPMLAGMH